MEIEQPEIKPDRRPWEFMTNCRMFQLYGQDEGTLACYHASKYRYFKGHGMLPEAAPTTPESPTAPPTPAAPGTEHYLSGCADQHAPGRNLGAEVGLHPPG
jgi:hypothetical protein